MSSSERGVATVHSLSVVAFLTVVAVTLLHVSLVIGARQRAATAAELAALAASRASVEGDEPCDTAADVARRNGAIVSECRMDADVATVTVQVTGGRWVVGRWTAERRARAAPAWYLE